MAHSNRRKKIFVAGHLGMVGSAILRKLKEDPAYELCVRTRSELDLTQQKAVQDFFQSERPDEVYLAAAHVGGIYANNTQPARFIYDNLMIEANIIHQAFSAGTKKLLFLGSSCIYPREAVQPMSEEVILTDTLEPTNEPYAIAKIAGIKLCESYNRQYGASHGVDFRSAMPTNIYGPGDNFDPENSHVIPGLIRRMHDAKIQNVPEIAIWGSGTPIREFLHVDDVAAACLHIMSLDKAKYDSITKPMLSHINVGSGRGITIRDLGKIIAKIVGFKGKIVFDPSMPDGTPEKILDSRRLNALGWRQTIELEDGIRSTYHWLTNTDKARL